MAIPLAFIHTYSEIAFFFFFLEIYCQLWIKKTKSVV